MHHFAQIGDDQVGARDAPPTVGARRGAPNSLELRSAEEQLEKQLTRDVQMLDFDASVDASLHKIARLLQLDAVRLVFQAHEIS